MTTLHAHPSESPPATPPPQHHAEPHPAGPLAAEAAAVNAARSDPAAFQSIYNAHYPALAQYLYRRTGDASLSDTLAGQTLAAAWKALPAFDTGRVPIRCWLFRIATNELRAHRRGLARARRKLDEWARRKQPQQGADPPASDSLSLAQEVTHALSALNSLPARQREALGLFYLAELSVEHVALTLDCPPGTVKSLLARGRERLRQRLDRNTDSTLPQRPSRHRATP